MRSRVRTLYSQGKENRVCRRHEGVPCVPCFIFQKVNWSVSNRSFPALTVFPVWMTGMSSAASSTSSSTDFSGRMYLMSTAPTKRCTIALSGGAGSVFLIKFSMIWQIKYLLTAPRCSTPPISRLTARRQACSKRGFSTSYRANKRWPEF